MKLDHHSVIVGATQTGKTTTALRLLQMQEGLKIFINTKRQKHWYDFEEYPDTACVKYQCYNEHNMQTIYDYYEEFQDGIIQIVPEATNKDALEDLEKILNTILFAHQTDDSLITTILVDEIQVFQSAHSCNDTLGRMWVMGLDVWL